MIAGIEKYKSIDFYARQVVEGFITGLHRSPFHGFSVEFSEHRPYNTGESTHDIDWKLYGRTDKFYVKRFEEETNLRCQIMIDHSGSMRFPTENQGDLEHPNKLTFSIYAAAILVEILSRQRDAYGLTLFGEQIDLQTDTHSNFAHKQRIMQLLDAELNNKSFDSDRPHTTTIAESLHLTAECLHKRSLVVIFTDAFVGKEEQDRLMDALRHLKHCKHEVILFHTYETPHEIDFNYDNKPTEFIDLESGERLKVMPNEINGNYQEEMLRQIETLRNNAIQYHIDYEPVNIEKGFESIMRPFLTKRAKHA